VSNAVGKWLCVGNWHGVVWLARLELPFVGRLVGPRRRLTIGCHHGGVGHNKALDHLRRNLRERGNCDSSDEIRKGDVWLFATAAWRMDDPRLRFATRGLYLPTCPYRCLAPTPTPLLLVTIALLVFLLRYLRSSSRHAVTHRSHRPRSSTAAGSYGHLLGAPKPRSLRDRRLISAINREPSRSSGIGPGIILVSQSCLPRPNG